MQVTITFYHDVICPYCYVMSKRLRRVIKDFNGLVRVKHKSFMIIPDLQDIKEIAPTPEDAKEVIKREFEIVKKYFSDYDPEKVIRKSKFTYIWSLPPQLGCKAAEFQGGDDMHWAFFDEAQDRFFLEGEDITNEYVLLDIAKKIGLDVQRFAKDLKSKEAKFAVIEDEEDAKAKGIKGVPAMIVNDYWLIRGVKDEEFLRNVIEDVIKYGEPKRVQLKAYWEKSD
ncbi:MAG: DsbA family protein [Sulfolobaceae archaeon]